MARYKIAHGNHAKGRIKGSWRLVVQGPKEVPPRRESSTNVNQLGDQRCNTNFIKHCVKGKKKVLMQKEEYIKSL